MNLEKMQRKDMKRRIVEHETRYGTGLRPLTPINNMTTTLMKNRRMDTPNKSRITPMRSTVTKKFGTAEKLSDFHSNNKRVRIVMLKSARPLRQISTPLL